MIFNSKIAKLFFNNKIKFRRFCLDSNHSLKSCKILKNRGCSEIAYRCNSTNNNKFIILGIETSCDDTGCAVMNEDGIILGESLNSQLAIHLKYGGVIPPVAQDLHRKNIEPVINESLDKAGVTLHNIDAIAVTVKPGLPLSLGIGFKYAKYLCRTYSKPMIPIHHMEAHALTARMEYAIEFPFLCLLISGGHCLLTLVNDINEFKLLGESIDDSPGEAFDKASRRLKLRNMDEFSEMSGGQAIETAAKKSKNPQLLKFSDALTRTRDCNFSISGYKSTMERFILRSERNNRIEGDTIIPEVYDLCAAFQIQLARHLCHRTVRAMEYIRIENLIPETKRTLVVSGGVACNNYIYNALSIICEENNFKIIRPRPKLCTDNGIMIAWNGVEKWRRGIDITDVDNIDSIKTEAKCKLGTSIYNQVLELNIKCNLIPMKQLYELNEKMKTYS